MAKKTTKKASKAKKKTAKKTTRKTASTHNSGAASKPDRHADGKWKKGQSGNPEGRRVEPDSLRKFRHISRVVSTEIFSSLNSMPLEQLEELENDKTLPALQHAAIKVIISAIKNGDQGKLNFIIEQSCGKMPETLNANVNDVTDLVQKVSTEDLKALAQKANDGLPTKGSDG